MVLASESAVTLLTRIAQGDRQAFNAFYDRYAAMVFGLIRRVVRDAPVAEEVLQEVFWRIWQEAAQYDASRGTPEAWLVMRARTRAIDRLRAIRRRDRTFVVPIDSSVERRPDIQAENPGVAAEQRGLVEAALARLPAPQRTVIELGFFEGLTQTEIASRLGEPLGTVKTRARSALERLRQVLKPQEMRQS